MWSALQIPELSSKAMELEMLRSSRANGRRMCTGEERQIGECCAALPCVCLPISSHLILPMFKMQEEVCLHPVAWLCICASVFACLCTRC